MKSNQKIYVFLQLITPKLLQVNTQMNSEWYYFTYLVFRQGYLNALALAEHGTESHVHK